MKKVVVCLVIVLLVFATISPVYALDSTNQSACLSDMTEKECIEFVTSHGVEIPKELVTYESLGAFIKSVITTVENDPNHCFNINYYITLNLANQIKQVVNEYYGTGGTSSTLNSASTSSDYTLQDSTAVGTWSPYYLNYNCYAYALGHSYPTNGTWLWYYPGYFYDQSKFSLSLSVADMAELTEYDLRTLGYSCISDTTTYSDALALSSTHDIICLRKCSTTGKEDYHYMRYKSGSWYHKPGNTQPLKFKYLPYAKAWYNEVSFENVEYSGDRYYTGTIYYFAYRTDHKCSTTKYTGENYHLGTSHYYQYVDVCDYCGDTVYNYTWESVPCSGPPCSLLMSDPPDLLVE